MLISKDARNIKRKTQVSVEHESARRGEVMSSDFLRNNGVALSSPCWTSCCCEVLLLPSHVARVPGVQIHLFVICFVEFLSLYEIVNPNSLMS